MPRTQKFAAADSGVDGDDAIDDDIVWAKICLEIRSIGKPTTRDEGGKIIFVSDAEDDGEEILVGLEKTILVRIETKSGHGAGRPTTKLIDEAADRFAFLVKELHIGPTLQ